MPLSNAAILNAKPSGKTYALTDESGLSIQIQPSGRKWWRFRYRFLGKAKMISLGVYPDVGLKDARERRDAARKLLSYRSQYGSSPIWEIMKSMNTLTLLGRWRVGKYIA